MKKFAWVIAACMGLSAGVASAQQSGAYAGIAGGMAHSNATKQAVGYTTRTTDETTEAGFKAYGGYSFGTWGLEAGYYDFGNYAIAGTSTRGANARDDASANLFGVSAVGAFPLAKDWFVTPKLGVGYATTKYHCALVCTGLVDLTSHTLVPLYGVGVKWNFQPKLAVRLDWEGMSGAKLRFGAYEKKMNAGLFSIGIEAQF